MVTEATRSPRLAFVSVAGAPVLLRGGSNSCVAAHGGSDAAGDSCSGEISRMGLLHRMKSASIIRLQHHDQNSRNLVRVGIAISNIPLT